MTEGWTVQGEVGARLLGGGAIEVRCAGLTTQARYYKTLLKEFFRTSFPALPSSEGEFSVHIIMEYTGDPPWMDLDNLAKALLDALGGHLFDDDHQVARLIVERRPAAYEGIWMRAEPLQRPA